MDLIYLLLSIAGPFALATLWAFRKSEGGSCAERFSNVFRLNANAGLYDQPLFHFGTAIPILLFLVFGTIAWWSYSVDLTSEGFNKFIEISKLPLAMLAMVVPTGAIIASFHSTQQTAKQIVIAEQKSKSESFYQHRKELFDYFDRFEPHNYLGVLEARYKIFPTVHQHFFSGTPETGTPELRVTEFDLVHRCLEEVAVLLEKILTGLHYQPRFEEYRKACDTIHDICGYLGLHEINKELLCYEFEKGGANFKTVGQNPEELIAAFRYAFDFYDALCGFCGLVPMRVKGVPDFIYFGNRLPNVHQMQLNIVVILNVYRGEWNEVSA